MVFAPIPLISENMVAFWNVIGGVVALATFLILVIQYTRKLYELYKLNPYLKVYSNYEELWKKAREIFDNELKLGTGIKIKNIGLDLEKILPDIKSYIEENFKKDLQLAFSYNALIINPESPLIKPIINGNSNIKTEYVTASLKKLEDYKQLFKNNENIKLEIKSYEIPPVIHGIMINRKHLFLGLTEFDSGKLFGSNCPYIYLKYRNKSRTTMHYFSAFERWFNYTWKDE